MQDRHAGHLIVVNRILRASPPDNKVTTPDHDQVGMVDIERLPSARHDSKRNERPLTNPRVNIVRGEHIVASGGSCESTGIIARGLARDN